MSARFIRIAVGIAFAGLAVEALGITWAVDLWNHTHRHAFNPLVNYVSELGFPHRLPMARVFGWTLIISSAMSCPLLLALGAHIGTRLGYVAMITGIFAMTNAIALGFVSADFLLVHLLFALMFFFGALFTKLLFTISYLRKFPFRSSPFFIVAGIVCATACAVFLALLLKSLTVSIAVGIHNVQSYHRPPRFWDIAVAEWCVVVSIAVWVFAAALLLLRAKSRSPEVIKIAPAE